MIKILLTGGGSGGHIYPLLAVANSLKEIAVIENKSIELIYFGSFGEFKKEIEKEKIKIFKIAGGKYRNYSSILNALDGFKVFYSFFQAFVKLYFIMPDIIFSAGGPGALPIVMVGKFYRIPIVLLEPNSVPGRTNTISGRLAVRIAIAFQGASKYFNGKNIALVGSPIRKELIENIPDKKIAKDKLGFSLGIPLIMVLGGSQGSTRINDFIFANLDFLISQFQILHQVGQANFSEAQEKSNFLLKNFTEEERSRYKIIPYFEDPDLMKKAYAASDLIISRAGAGTIFEIAAFQKPAILIPLPEGKDQKANAYEYAETGAAIVMEQENLLTTLFRNQVIKILNDKPTQLKMIEAAGIFSRVDAASIIAHEIFKIVEN